MTWGKGKPLVVPREALSELDTREPDRLPWQMLVVAVTASVYGISIPLWRHTSVFLAAGLALTVTAMALWQLLPLKRSLRIAIAVVVLAVGLGPLAVGVHQLVCWYAPRPEPVERPLFDGVTYIREVTEQPYAAVVHILKVDLQRDGVEVLVTPPDFPGQKHALKARTTSAFLEEFQVQAAINGSHFFPFERRDPRSYNPWSGERKGILGGAASKGVEYGEPSPHYAVLHLDETGHGEIAKRPRPWYTATAGIKHFIVDGRPIPMSDDEGIACTVVGLDAAGETLFLVVVDGDQAPYSEGIGRASLTEILLEHGVANALSLDGGGSSTMAVAEADGSAKRLNRPVQGGIPGFERPVGNHIGIRARRLEAAD